MHEDDAVPMLGGIEMHIGYAWQFGGERRQFKIMRGKECEGANLGRQMTSRRPS